jgi:phosphoribosylanthranilate isomerase
MLQLKICGMREPKNIDLVSHLLPNYLGFIFYEKSKRFVADISPKILQEIPNNIEKVAVFVNETEDVIENIAHKYHFKTLQLHGNESPDFCKSLQQKGYTILKAFNVAEVEDIAQIAAYQKSIDFALLDAKGKEAGGNGVTFDWKLLENYAYEIPFFLSGGISLDNMAELKTLQHPKLYAIDVNSKFEISAGLKDVELLKKLKQAM